MRGLHVAAGLVGLASGAVALYALKGAVLHRRSGMVFVYAMLLMSGLGALLAARKGERFSVVAGVLTLYLVTSAWLTVRRGGGAGFRWVDLGGILLALTVGLASILLGFLALEDPTGQLDRLPAPLGFVFGAVALLAALGDVRWMLGLRTSGAPRIARHLWRMCFALFVAAGSFFLGQPQVFPEPLRSSGLLAVPVLLVLLLMTYWLLRVSLTRSLRSP